MIMRLLSLTLFAIFMSGCATVNRGATDYFRIDTVPQGAMATTTIETSDSKNRRNRNPKLKPVYESCEPTPCAIALPRRSEFVVKLEHEGYQPTELFITNSGSAAGYTANVTTTIMTTSGTVAATAPAIAAATTFGAQLGTAIASGTTAATLNLGTLGLVSAESAFALSNSLIGPATPTTTGSVVSGAVPPALAVTGAMLLTDMATGANLNLYPNPVVIGLAPEGTLARVDPNVEGFKALLAAQADRERYCQSTRRVVLEKNKEKCRKAIIKLKAMKKDRRERQAAAKKALKAARAKRKALASQ